MTPDLLRKIMPASGDRATLHADALTAAMGEFSISTARRQAAFLANVAEETGQLLWMRELGDGEAYEPELVPGKPANPKAIALGNSQAGDGKRFRGGGDLMLSGRGWYLRCGTALGIDLVGNPALIAMPYYAARTAGWFWATEGLNELADADKFGAVVRRINGGYNGLDTRIGFWLVGRKELQV